MDETEYRIKEKKTPKNYIWRFVNHSLKQVKLTSKSMLHQELTKKGR